MTSQPLSSRFGSKALRCVLNGRLARCASPFRSQLQPLQLSCHDGRLQSASPGRGSVRCLSSAELNDSNASATFRTTIPDGDGAVHGMVGAVGRTPLIHLRSVSERVGRRILAKAEFLNPGGSVKDRAALGIIQDAEDRGLLDPLNAEKYTVVEGTAGNTGIGLAHICLARGYKCVIFMPDTQSPGKIEQLKQLGADVRAVPAVPYDNPANYNHQARDYAEGTEGAYWTNQFDNPVNQAFHYATTGPEILRQAGGVVDGFVCATGTGGTLAGVSRFLKESRPETQIWLADPPGSVLYEFFRSGRMGVREGSSITEGIGQGRVTDNLAQAQHLVDGSVRIPDEDSIAMVFQLLAREGIPVGASSGLNVAAAVRLAETLPKGATVVTVLCDGMRNYAPRLMNASWLSSKSLLAALPEDIQQKFLQQS